MFVTQSRFIRAIALGATLPFAAAAQAPGETRVPTSTERVSLSGPRFGVTMLGGGIVDSLKTKYNTKVGSVITQFGWQWEKQFLGRPGGVEALSETVLLIGGLDQGVFLPSLTWLVGLRSSEGMEFGVGPNITPAGAALAVAGGITIGYGALNLPINVAVVPSAIGTRISMLTGFTLR